MEDVRKLQRAGQEAGRRAKQSKDMKAKLRSFFNKCHLFSLIFCYYLLLPVTTCYYLLLPVTTNYLSFIYIFIHICSILFIHVHLLIVKCLHCGHHFHVTVVFAQVPNKWTGCRGGLASWSLWIYRRPSNAKVEVRSVKQTRIENDRQTTCCVILFAYICLCLLMFALHVLHHFPRS